MAEGFILSDKTRRAVFVGVLSGERELDRIIRKHRLIKRMAERAAKDLKSEGYLQGEESALQLTDDGEKAAADLRRRKLLE